MTPNIIVKEHISGSYDVYLLVESTLIFELSGIEIPVCLLGAYYVFNMEYAHGTKSFFTFLAVCLLDIKPNGKIPLIVENMLIALP